MVRDGRGNTAFTEKQNKTKKLHNVHWNKQQQKKLHYKPDKINTDR